PYRLGAPGRAPVLGARRGRPSARRVAARSAGIGTRPDAPQVFTRVRALARAGRPAGTPPLLRTRWRLALPLQRRAGPSRRGRPRLPSRLRVLRPLPDVHG